MIFVAQTDPHYFHYLKVILQFSKVDFETKIDTFLLDRSEPEKYETIAEFLRSLVSIAFSKDQDWQELLSELPSERKIYGEAIDQAGEV